MRYKKAVGPNSPEQIAQLNQTLLRQTLAAAAVGLGAGSGLRGLTGLLNTVRDNTTQPPRSAYAPIAIDMPVLPSTKKKKAPGEKLAGQGAGEWLGKHAPSVSRAAIDAWIQPLKLLFNPVKDTFQNAYAQNTGEMWQGPAITTAGAVGGGLAGWKLTDYLFDKQRKNLLKSDVDTAKQQFEEALAGKTAGLARDLDRLCDLAEKRSENGLQRGLGTVAGVGLTAAGALALLSAHAGYTNARKRDETSIIEKAREEHARALQAARPMAVFARPVESDYL
jgi:hypothetical protein